MSQLPIAIKSGALARILQSYLPEMTIIPSKTRTGEFPSDTVVIRPYRWEPQAMNDPERYRPITLRFTLRNAVPSTQNTYGYERKLHMDLAWIGDEKTWSVMPALSSGFMPLNIYKQFQSTVDYLISIISNVADQQKGI